LVVEVLEVLVVATQVMEPVQELAIVVQLVLVVALVHLL
jgi:hypothetical protein